MNYKKLFLAIIAIVCTTTLFAQKKSETKLYNSTVALCDTVAFNKFLAKYPQSVYAPAIQAMKDSLIRVYNTSTLTKTQAAEIFKANVEAAKNGKYGEDFLVLSGRKNNVEYILGVIAPASNDPLSFNVIKIQEDGNGGWQTLFNTSNSRYMQDDALTLFSLSPALDPFGKYAEAEEVIIDNEKYLHFNYINFTEGTDPRSGWAKDGIELITNVISMQDESVFSAMYSGVRAGNTIEGSCPEIAQAGAMASSQMKYLLRAMRKIEALKPFDEEKEMTKKVIEWWYENNKPGTSKLSFGALDNGHPIVKRFLEDKYIESSKTNKATFFDIMGTTVICCYNKTSQQYLLLHCEKQPADPKTDKALNSLYFEKDHVIALYYYKGKTAIKERIDLNTKTKR